MTIVTFFALLLFAAVVALLLAPPLMADMKLAPEAAAALRASRRLRVRAEPRRR